MFPKEERKPALWLPFFFCYPDVPPDSGPVSLTPNQAPGPRRKNVGILKF